MAVNHPLVTHFCFRGTARASEETSTRRLGNGWMAGRPGGKGSQVRGVRPSRPPSLEAGAAGRGCIWGQRPHGTLGMLCPLGCSSQHQALGIREGEPWSSVHRASRTRTRKTREGCGRGEERAPSRGRPPLGLRGTFGLAGLLRDSRQEASLSHLVAMETGPLT